MVYQNWVRYMRIGYGISELVIYLYQNWDMVYQNSEYTYIIIGIRYLSELGYTYIRIG